MYCSKTTVTVFLVVCLTIGGLAVWGLGSSTTEVAKLPGETPVENIGGDRPMNLNGLLRWIK